MSLEVGDSMNVTKKNISQNFTGKIIRIKNELVMPRFPTYGTEIKYFIKFDMNSYKSILLHGWQIYCYIFTPFLI